MRYRILLLCLLGMTVASGLHAQRPAKDKEKARQWQSMENGPWDFAPDWYYFFLHKKYPVSCFHYWKKKYGLSHSYSKHAEPIGDSFISFNIYDALLPMFRKDRYA